MSNPPPAASNLRRQDSSGGGQSLLLIVSVATSAIFASLFIASKFSAEAPGEAPPTAVAVAQEPAPAAPGAPDPAAERFEPTDLVVEQLLVAGGAPGAKPEKIVARTPVVFESGTLQWSPEETQRARALQGKLAAILRHQDALNRELLRLDAEWQDLVRLGTPAPILRADSLSLPAPDAVAPPAPKDPAPPSTPENQ